MKRNEKFKSNLSNEHKRRRIKQSSSEETEQKKIKKK